MSLQITANPWRHQQDLLDVRDQFFAYRQIQVQHVTTDEDVATSAQKGLDDDQRLAINTVAVWEYRGQVPHPIIATAGLIDSLLTFRQFNDEQEAASRSIDYNDDNDDNDDATSDKEQQADKQVHYQHNRHQKLPPFAARALFATAIARFVTGYCDVGHGGSIKRSMYDVAAEIGMPEEFVAMRHEIVHGAALPQVPEMRVVAQHALEWLWLVYWCKLDIEDEEASAKSLPPAVRQQVQMQLKELLKLRKDFIKARGKLFPVDHYSDIVKSVRKYAVAAAASIAEILIADRLLLPSSKTQEPNMKAAFLIWDQPLEYFMASLATFHSELLSALQTRLLEHRYANNARERDTIIAWIVHLVASDSYSPSCVDDARRKNAIDDVMEFCLLNPNAATCALSDQIISVAAEDADAAWSSLREVSHKAINSPVDDKDLSVVMDLDSAGASKLDEQAQYSNHMQEGGWKPMQGVWTPRPIGVLNQTNHM